MQPQTTNNEDEFDEYIYALDVYVHHVIMNDDLLTRNHLQPIEHVSCLIGYRVWNFPLLYIEQQRTNMEEFAFTGQPASTIVPRGDGTEQLYFNSGKTCLFKMSTRKSWV